MAVRTRVGDIYQCSGEFSNFYLYLVALDINTMNSDVVILYKDNPLMMDESELTSSMVFYTHTIVNPGVKKGLWSKIGFKQPTIDLSSLLFKKFRDSETIELLTGKKNAQPEWEVWTPLDSERKVLSNEQGLNLVAEKGSIPPPADILYRLKHGKSEFRGV